MDRDYTTTLGGIAMGAQVGAASQAYAINEQPRLLALLDGMSQLEKRLEETGSRLQSELNRIVGTAPTMPMAGETAPPADRGILGTAEQTLVRVQRLTRLFNDEIDRLQSI